MDDESRVTPSSNGTRLPARQRLSVKRRLKPAASVSPAADHDMEELSARRLALFEPLGPSSLGQIGSPESVIPPPDFEPSSNPRDWVLGKKRKLVNVDVVESMRRIAVQEMNRKDREINGLNEQLEEDGRTMELIQMQLQQERSKRLQVERENAVLQGKVNMLMAYLQETEEAEAMLEDSEQGQSADPGATRLRP